MLILDTILEEIKDVPVNRLEELYRFVHALTLSKKKSEALNKRILSYGGILSDMDKEDYADFVHHTQSMRTDLFDRNVTL
ncbi:MAG: hypothetical protein QM610_01740 [Chitinophagaceae bacterium]